MLTVKRLLAIVVAMIATCDVALADFSLPAVPKKFHGAWVCADSGTTTISAIGSGIRYIK
jgi:hypothetical protein